MLRCASLALIAAVAVPVAAQTPAPQATPPAQSAAKVNELDKVVCKKEDSLGSRLSAKRVCLTVREWRQQAEDSREATERLQQGQGVVPSS